MGDDQRQHVELARDIAERFNRLFGETFVVPDAVIPDVGARVMGLNDPAVKMAKTHSDVRGHAVALLDDAKEIERTFKRAVTDSGNEIAFSDDPARAGVNNLLGIYKVVTGRGNDEVERDFQDARGYGDLKSRVAEVVIEELRPVQERYHRLIEDVGELDALMAQGRGAGGGRERPEDRRGEGAHRPGASREGRRMSGGVKYHPSLDEMRRLAGSGNLAPVYREMPAGDENPVSAYLKVARPPYSFLLESVEGGESVARYSFIGTDPYDVIRTGPGEKLGATDPLVHVERELAGRVAVGLPEDQRFNGGAVGYMSYEAVRYFERLPSPDPDPLGVPESIFMMTDTFLIFDHVLQKIRIVSYARLDDGVERGYADAVRRIEDMVDRLNGPVEMPPQPEGPPPNGQVESNMSRREYESMVEAVKEYVVAGDVIQAVVAQRFRRPTSAHPFHIYRALRAINPSPYMYYLDLDGFQIVGASPELLVQVESGEVATHPIAGTRPRGDTPGEDLELEADLRVDEKERAEHIMLVDLGRNDIGRVSVPGTVEVTQLMDVERYSHVMHLVSHVTGKLDPGYSCYDVLRACFPAGTVSGAPKIRAMEIIAELEPDKRGPYAGAVGYFDFMGNMDTAITIRTLVVKDGVAYVEAGGGIVYDSQPYSGVRGDGTQGVRRAAGDRAGGEAIGPVGRAQ